jgi:hypothetical protein
MFQAHKSKNQATVSGKDSMGKSDPISSGMIILAMHRRGKK